MLGYLPVIAQGREPGEVYVRGVGFIRVETWDDGMIFDTIYIRPTSGTTLAGGTRYIFFQDLLRPQAVVSAWGGENLKPASETNMTTPGQLPSGWELIVLDIGVHIPADISRTDANAILKYGYLEFKLDGSSVRMSGPLTRFASGYGIWGTANVASTSGSVNVGIYQNGLPSIAGKPLLSLPIYITDKRTFRAELVFEEDITLSASDVIIPVTMYLAGLLKAPVQG